MNPTTNFAFFDVGATGLPEYKFNEVYNPNGANEASLYNSIYNEFSWHYGTDIVFIERTVYDAESVFGEFMAKVYTRGTPMRLFIEQVDGWGGQGDIYSKFGIQITDECTVYCPKITFEQHLVGLCPKYGDLIYVPKSRKLFEIKHIEDELPPTFYLLGNRAGYVMSCKAFVYDHSEVLDSDGMPEEVAALDNLILDLQNNPKYDEINSKELANQNDKFTQIAHSGTVLDHTEIDPLVGGY
jgi:hypothetical protein